MPRYYSAQQLDSIEYVLDKSVTGDAAEAAWMKQLLEDRNALWLKKLEGLFARERCFVAVGAAHLIKDAGLIAGLRHMGYNVVPVMYR